MAIAAILGKYVREVVALRSLRPRYVEVHDVRGRGLALYNN
jgi:4-aminobutyrate aminotransferase-like enzyme